MKHLTSIQIVLSTIVLSLFFNYSNAQTCDDYSNPLLWNTPGVATGVGTLGVTGGTSGTVVYDDFASSNQTFRLEKHFGPVGSTFRFEFDFILYQGTQTDVGANILSITENATHTNYVNASINTSGTSWVQTTNSSIGVYLGNPLGGGTSSYNISGVSKYQNVPGTPSAGIPISLNTWYTVRLQRMTAQKVELSLFSGGNHIATVCYLINPLISGLEHLQHSVRNDGTWTRMNNIEIDDLCHYPTLVGTPCTNCAPVVSVTDLYDCASGTGTLTASVTGGIGPFSYLWSNSATTSSTTISGPGTYTVTVTDATGCVTVVNHVVDPLDDIEVIYSTQDAACSGSCTGALSVTSVQGATGTISYELNGVVQASPNFNNLCPGTHTLEVHVGTCTKVLTIQIGIDNGCWQQSTQNNSFLDMATDVEVDDQGNVYAVGHFDDFTEFECGSTAHSRTTLNAKRGMFLTKFNSCGDVLWVAWSDDPTTSSVGVEATAIDLDEAAGNIYITGSFKGASNVFHGGDMMSSLLPPTTPLGALSSTNSYFVAQYKMNTGAIDWLVDQWTGPGDAFNPTGICHKGTNVYVGGYTDGSAITFIGKITTSGTPTIAYTSYLADHNVYTQDIEMQSTGTIVAVGYFKGLLGMGIVGIDAAVSGGMGSLNDGFIMGISDVSIGAQEIWVSTTKADIGNAELHDASIGPSDEIYATGHVEGSTIHSFAMQFGATSVSLPANTMKSKAVVARVESTGLWGGNSWMNYTDDVNAVNGVGRGIDVESGLVSVNGNMGSSGTVQFLSAGSNIYNGPGQAVVNANLVYISQMSTTGTVSELTTTLGNGMQTAEALASNDVLAYSVGAYDQTLTLAGNNYTGNIALNTKAFFIRNALSVSGMPFTAPQDQSVGLPLPIVKPSLSTVYPNPASALLHIYSSQTQTVEVTNSLGQQVVMLEMQKDETLDLDILAHKPGFYFVKFQGEGLLVKVIKR